jgi:hypothetical protein
LGFAQASARHLSSLRSRAAPWDLNSGAKNTFHRGGLNGTGSNLVLERAEMLLHRQGESPPRAKPTLAPFDGGRPVGEPPPSRHNLPDSDTGRPWSRCHSDGRCVRRGALLHAAAHARIRHPVRAGSRAEEPRPPGAAPHLVADRHRAHPWPGALVGSLHGSCARCSTTRRHSRSRACSFTRRCWVSAR